MLSENKESNMNITEYHLKGCTVRIHQRIMNEEEKEEWRKRVKAAAVKFFQAIMRIQRQKENEQRSKNESR